MANSIVFLDMKRREEVEIQRLKDRKFQLETRALEGTYSRVRKGSGTGAKGLLPSVLQLELDTIRGTINRTDSKGPYSVADPLFKEVQKELERTHQKVEDHHQGKLLSQMRGGPLTEDEQALAAVYGILLRDNITKPELGGRFTRAVATARGEYNTYRELFNGVLPILISEGNYAVHEQQWATVVSHLASDGVQASDTHLSLKVQRALSGIESLDDNAPPSAIDIDLPDLEQDTAVDIVKDNLLAMQAIYFSAMLEELKLYQVVDKLAEMFQFGMLPISKGKAGDFLYQYWKRSSSRVSETERRNLYARAFGMPGGDATSGIPNRGFNDLWLRFVSAVSSYCRQFKVDSLLRSSMPVVVSQEQVRKSGRDLAANLSLHGYGIAYFVATELQSDLKDFITLLSNDEVKGSYGARDMWQVIDQVATLELGGARDSIRYRTMANSGAVIIRWLAKKAVLLGGSSLLDVLDLDELSRPTIRAKGTKPTTDPTDTDLLNACEQWLAVTGTTDERVLQFAQPSETPATTSRPIQIPSIARDMLAQAGVSVNGMSRN